MGWFFFKTADTLATVRCTLREACHCGCLPSTSNRKEHKIIQRAGPERDTIFHLHVTVCRGRGTHGHDEQLAWVASWGQGTSCSNSFVSKVLGANYKTVIKLLPVAQKCTMCTDRKQPLNLPVMRMCVWIVTRKNIDVQVRLGQLERATRSEADTLG